MKKDFSGTLFLVVGNSGSGKDSIIYGTAKKYPQNLKKAHVVKRYMTRSQLQEMIRPVMGDLEEFDRRLDKYLEADSKLITAVVKHIMASRGKR